MKNHQLLLRFVLLFVFLNALPITTLATPRVQNYPKTPHGYSQECFDQSLGIKFHCNPNWKMQRDDNKLTVTLSTYPEVLFTVEKTKSRLGFLSQINKLNLENMNRYAKGFDTEHNTIANRETLKVKAFSQKNPRVRLAEYYLIHNLTLYRVTFSVNPRDEWNNYKFLIKTIIESFNFI